MKRSIPVLALLVLAMIEAVATGRPIFYNLASSLLAIVVLAYLWAWYNVCWIALERHTISERTQVGKAAEERFVVRNVGPFGKQWLEVLDHSELPGHHASMVVNSLPAGRDRGWSVRTICQQRGRFRLGPLTVASGDPFGLFTHRRQVPLTGSILVYPLAVDLPHFGSESGQVTGGGRLYRRTHYVTSNVASVRDYYPGDTFNRIHWPSTARTGRLVVKEFELDPMAEVWLFADMEAAVQAVLPPGLSPAAAYGDLPILPAHPLASLHPSTEEYVVAVAASLARYYLGRNRAVGLLMQGRERELVLPDRGERQMVKLYESLAVVRAQGQVNMAQLLAAEASSFGRNSVVVVITPSTDDPWVRVLRDLGQRGVHGIAVVIDPQGFGSSREAGGIMQALAESGIPGYRVRQGDSLVAALAGPLPAPGS